jgi:DNA-binding PadR family transcriptional regulator
VARSNEPDATPQLSEAALLVLAALGGGAKHGYAIIQEIEREAGQRMGPGTLYGIIARLERASLIEPLAMEERGRVPYRITGGGRRTLSARLAALRQYQATLKALAAR